MKKKILVGMSGGVDSSVAAIALKEKGYEVIGVFMKAWPSDAPLRQHPPEAGKSACYGPDENDIEDVKKICECIGIPFHVIDMSREYRKWVLDYFIREYRNGKTPNPCIICNRFVKFHLLLEKSTSAGIQFDYFATGHYAQVEYDRERNRYLLKRAVDEEKDQSYFLYLLTQQQLSRVLFPLWTYKKAQVRNMAKKYKLSVVNKPESQDFISGDCFYLFENGTKPGDVVDINGNVLGKHKGIVFYTIGQRKGLGISSKHPLYVVKIDAEKNTLIMGEKKDVYSDELIAANINLISVDTIEKPIKVVAKVRYKHKLSPAVVCSAGDGKVRVKFDKPQWAVTPGQSVVFYDKNTVIGGGIIE